MVIGRSRFAAGFLWWLGCGRLVGHRCACVVRLAQVLGEGGRMRWNSPKRWARGVGSGEIRPSIGRGRKNEVEFAQTLGEGSRKW